MLPLALDTITDRPARSATVRIGDFPGTIIAMLCGEERVTAAIFNRQPAAAASTTGISPAGAVSTAPALRASSRGAAPAKLAQVTG